MISLCLCPLSPEFQALAAALKDLGYESTSPDVLDHQLLFFPHLNLYLGKAGIGSARYQKNASWYIQKTKPSLFMCAGGAGALIPDLEIGTVVTHAFDRKLLEKFTTDGVLSGTNTILTNENIVSDQGVANELHAETGAIAVALEGRGAFDAAGIAGIPCIEIRGITDNVFLSDSYDVAIEFEKNLQLAMGNVARLISVF